MTRIGNCELHHIDCLEYMATLPDKAFDLAIVDPPYGIERFKTGVNSGGRMFGSDERADKSGLVWDVRPGEKYFTELMRVSIQQIIWGANYFLEHLPSSRGIVFWDKKQPVDNFSAGELAWSSFDCPAKCFRHMYTNVAGRDKTHIHPTQKPIALYEWLLTNYAKPGQRILDTHLGSGSSAIACNNLGFELVGCELDKDYYDAACKRIHQATAQERLFA